MPQIQNIDDSADYVDPLGSLLQGFTDRREKLKESDALSSIYRDYNKDRTDIDNLIQQYRTNPDISPTARVEGVKEALEMRKQNFELQKAQSKQKPALDPMQKEKLRQDLLNDGMPPHEVDIYLESKPGVQQVIARNHSEEKQRGLRKPVSNPAIQQVEQGDPSVNTPTGQSAPGAKPASEDWPVIPPDPNTTAKEREVSAGKREKANNEKLQEIEKKTRATRGIQIRLKQLGDLSEKVPDGLGRAVIDPNTGNPYPWAQIAKLPGVDKNVERYVKTLNDFTIDAKDYFGNRVTNFDLSSFQSRLPGLMNSAAGRRSIIKYMDLMSRLENVHDKEMEKALSHYGRNASYNEIKKIVDQRVESREAQIIAQLDNLGAATDQLDKMAANPQKFKGYELFEDDKGQFIAVPPDKVQRALAKQGWSKY